MQLQSNSTLENSLDGDNNFIEFLLSRGPKSTQISLKLDKGKCTYEYNPTCAYLWRSSLNKSGPPWKVIHTSHLYLIWKQSWNTLLSWFLSCTSLRLVRRGSGSLWGEISGSEAHISDLGFWASVVGTTQEGLDYILPHKMSSMWLYPSSYMENSLYMWLGVRVFVVQI